MKNFIKVFLFFICSFIIGRLCFNLITYIQGQIPKSNIDGSTYILGIRLTSMQLSNFLYITTLIIDAIVQTILAIVYKKLDTGSNQYRNLKVIIISIVSYIVFLIVLYISLMIEYSNIMTNFH